MFSFFFFNDTATTEIYTLPLHDALPICTTSSTCLVTFTANTLGSYTITATYNPAPTSVHATSNEIGRAHVSTPATATTRISPSSTPTNSPLSCTVTVADTDSAPKSAPLGMVSFVVSTSPSFFF